MQAKLVSLAMALAAALAGNAAFAQQPATTSAPTASVPANATLAQASSSPRNSHFISEVKVGVLSHDIPLFGSNKEEGADLNGEVLFESPAFLKWAYSPRPLVGFDLNLSGDTSAIYIGLGWNFDLVKTADGSALFIAPALGGAWHDGKIDKESQDRKALGSSILFREGLDIGWRFSGGVSVSAFLDHISNASLAEHNEGLTNGGVRIGYKF